MSLGLAPRASARLVAVAVALLVALVAVGCAGSRRTGAGASASPRARAPEGGLVAPAPPLPAVERARWLRLLGWTASDHLTLSVRGPVAFVPAAGRRLLAAVLTRRTSRSRLPSGPARYEHVLVVAAHAAGDLRLVGSLPLGVVTVDWRGPGTSIAVITRLRLAREDVVRVDVSKFTDDRPRRFATKAVIAGVVDGRVMPLLERLVESGHDYLDRRADLSVVDVDRDGVSELVANERTNGPPRTRAARRLVYRRSAKGYVTSDRSLFEE